MISLKCQLSEGKMEDLSTSYEEVIPVCYRSSSIALLVPEAPGRYVSCRTLRYGVLLAESLEGT